MTPPKEIHFSVIKNGIDITNTVKESLILYYKENQEIKKPDLIFVENPDQKRNYFYSHFPSLSTEENRIFYIKSDENSFENKIEISLNLINKECKTFEITSVLVNNKEVILDKSLLPYTYKFQIN